MEWDGDHEVEEGSGRISRINSVHGQEWRNDLEIGRFSLGGHLPSPIANVPIPLEKDYDSNTKVSWDFDSDRMYSFAQLLKMAKTRVGSASTPDNTPEAQRMEIGPLPTYNLKILNLTYKVAERSSNWRRGREQRTLLNNITAQANHSQILAIVGPSGASKTTLLDALAGRISRRSLSGTVLVNGVEMDDSFKRISGYVMQDDALFPMLTARETLMFSARLRLRRKEVPFMEMRTRVEKLLDQLGLRHCAGTRVGNDQIGGVSGGERRRISIGVDVIHDPSVLFLDEPTSGLDSTSALQVMQSLQKMAEERKRTIILTIHQPSYRILQTLHRTLVLAKGNVIYHGHHSGMVSYFSRLGHVVPDHVNVLEYMMDTVESYQRKPETLQWLVDLHKDKFGQDPDDDGKITFSGVFSNTRVKNSFANSLPWEVWALSERTFKNIFRTRTLFFSRVAITILTSLLMASLFHNSPQNSKGVHDRQTFFAFTLAIFVFTSTESIPIYLHERRIFVRETSRGAYRASSYVISHSIVILPFLLFLAVLCTLLSYFAIGLTLKGNAPYMFTLVIFLVLVMSNALTAFISGLAANFISGLAVFGAVGSYSFLFSGFFMPRNEIPVYWLWLHYGSLFKYPFESLLQNEFRHLPNVIWDKSLNLTSQNILALYEIKKDDVYLNVFFMLAFVFGFRLLNYCTLRFLTKNTRR